MKKFIPNSLIDFIFLFITFIFIPVYGIIFSNYQSLLYDNLTNLNITHHLLYLSYGIIVSLTYFIEFYLLLKRSKMYSNKLFIISLILTSLSIISFLLPYHKDNVDIISNLHVYLALFSSVSTLVLLLYFNYKLLFINFNLYLNLRNMFIVFYGIFITLLLIIGDISGILELLMNFGISFILYIMIKSF